MAKKNNEEVIVETPVVDEVKVETPKPEVKAETPKPAKKVVEENAANGRVSIDSNGVYTDKFGKVIEPVRARNMGLDKRIK